MPIFCQKVPRFPLQCQQILKFISVLAKRVHLEGRLAPNWPPDFCHLGAETCAAPWCPCPHGSLLIGGGMPAVPLSGLPGSAVPTEEAPGLSCRHPEPETKRPQKSGNPLLGNPSFGCMDEIFHQHSLPGKYWFRSLRYFPRDYV